MTLIEGEGAQAPEIHTDRLTVEFVAGLVGLATGIPAQEIAATTRVTAHAARARQIAMYLTHVGLSWPMARVGIAFGRDRSTACHAAHRIEDMRDEPAFDAVMTELEAVIRHAPPPLAVQ